MKVLADIPELVPAFPDKVITMRRSSLERERDSVKKYLQALTEGTYLVNTNREISAGILRKRLGLRITKSLKRIEYLHRYIQSSAARGARRFERCFGADAAAKRRRQS